QNRVAEAWSGGDAPRARAVVCQSFTLFCGLMLILLAALVPLAWCFDFASIFGLKSPALIHDAPFAVAMTIGTFCAALPFALAQRVAQGLQRGWMHNVSQAIGNVLALGSVCL